MKSDRDLGPDLASDPDIARAMALFSGAKAEAKSLVPGEDADSVKMRHELQSRLTQDLIERNGLGINGESCENRGEIKEAEAAVQGS